MEKNDAPLEKRTRSGRRSKSSEVRNTRSRSKSQHEPTLDSPVVTANFEDNNNFVEMTVPGNISEEYRSELESPVESENDSEVELSLPGKEGPAESNDSRSRSRSATPRHRRRHVSEDQQSGSEHEATLPRKHLRDAELKQAKDTLGIVQKFMVKKGLINAEMSHDEVMELMTREDSSDEADMGHQPSRQPRKDKHEKHLKGKKNKGKTLINSPSEVTIYLRAVPCKTDKLTKKGLQQPEIIRGVSNNKALCKSDSSTALDTSDELPVHDEETNALHFLTDPKRFERERRTPLSDSSSRSRTRSRSCSHSRTPSEEVYHCRQRS